MMHLPSGLFRSILLRSEWMLLVFVYLLLETDLEALLGFSYFSLWCFRGARAGTEGSRMVTWGIRQS